ncbi:MAG: ECF-type sigma factor [Acidobacteriota bacterium]|nr:ECF-type sigma factor [Acidobacteriota bacterium]
MLSPNPADFTLLLSLWRQGDTDAGAQVFSLIYQDLRRMAQSYMNHERNEHTLQATALVHEAYLRLFGGCRVAVWSRAHLCRLFAMQMRRLLIDHARSAHARKRDGGGGQRLPLAEAALIARMDGEELLALDVALGELEKIWPRACRVVELRCFAGCTIEKAAETLGVSTSQVKRDWRFARTWLYKQVGH